MRMQVCATNQWVADWVWRDIDSRVDACARELGISSDTAKDIARNGILEWILHAAAPAGNA